MKSQKGRLRTTQLPDEIIVEILLRLPVEKVHKFRSVCRKWKALTSTPDFVERHMRQRVPGILLQENAGCNPELFLIQRWEEEATNMNLRITDCHPNCIKAESWHSYHPCFSYDGLVVLEGNFHESKKRGFRSWLKDFVIYNPIDQETVRILIPQRLRGEICGLFMHPRLKEYCALLGLLQGGKIQFKMVNLGPKEPHWKEIQASYSDSHRLNLPPVHVDDVLYWTLVSSPSCEEFIMAFDIKHEKFSPVPHPGTKSDCNPGSHREMDLLNLDMHLSLAQISSPPNNTTTNIHIWILIEERIWVKKYSINVGFEEYSRPGIGLNRAIGIVNGELLLQCDYETFYACNLQKQSIKKFGRKYVGCWRALIHCESLVSLKNCKPEIRMKEETTRRRMTRSRISK